MFHQNTRGPSRPMRRWGDWLSAKFWYHPPRNWRNVPWKGNHVFEGNVMIFPTSNFHKKICWVFRGVPHGSCSYFTLRIMGSQVTGGLEIQKPPRYTHPHPSFWQGPVILKVTSSAYSFKFLQAKFYCTTYPYMFLGFLLVSPESTQQYTFQHPDSRYPNNYTGWW